MQTEYRSATYGEIPPHRAVVRPVLAVDPGNRFTKWIDCQTVRSIPSYVKELADWEEGEHDAQSFEIGRILECLSIPANLMRPCQHLAPFS